MEEASECDRILVMREGRLLADATLDALLAQTGATDITGAFLALVDADRKQDSGAGGA
jgi:ABC-2 type transport system ATP-binding protein